MTSSATALLKRVTSAQFVRGVAVIAGGSAIAQAIPVLLTPVLTRLYTPADLGMLALYTAFISFAANATTLGYSQAIVSGRTDREGADLVAISALAVIPVSVLGSLVLLLLSFNDWLGFGEFPWWTSVAMALSLVLTGFFFTLRYWLIRMGAYRSLSVATISQSIGRIGTQIVAGVVGIGWTGLVLGEIGGRSFGLVRMWNEGRTTLTAAVRGTGVRRLRTVAGQYKKFPFVAAPSSVLNSLALVLPVPLITMYFGVQAAGQYSIASRVLVLPLSLIGASVGDVFHNRVAQLSRENPGRALPLFYRVSLGLFLLGLLPMVIVVLAGEDLFTFVLGGDWSIAGSIATSITPWVLMQLAVSPVSRVVQVYRAQELKLVYDIVGLLSIAGVLSLGSYRGWSLVETCTLLGLSQAVVYGMYFMLLVRIMKRNSMINKEEAQGGLGEA